MKNRISLTLCAVLLGFTTSAQTYTFSVGTNPYVELDNAIYLSPEGEVWDDPEFEFNFPFAFDYFGVNLPALTGSFGYGAELFGTNFNLPVPVIVPVFCDPIDLGYMTDESLSSISYQVVGNSGSRILKVQWKNIGFYGQVVDDATPLDYMNYQAWFYEGSNRIEVRFGPSVITNPFEHFDNPGPSVFLISTYNFNTDQLGNSYYLYGNPANPTMDLTMDSQVLFTSNLDGIPADGQTYIFTPGTPSGVGLEKNNITFSIFPNPSTSSLNVLSSNDLEIIEIQILDISGRVVQTIFNPAQQLNIEDLNIGHYIIKISTQFGEYTEKFMKQ